MKLQPFRTLDAVLRLGTMAAAADDMHLTPSAVSMQMKQIEEYLGQPLFDRSGSQARPMPLAYDVAAAMNRAFGQIDLVRRHPGVAIEGVVRLGVIDTMQPSVLPGTLRLLKQRFPYLHVKPMRGKSAELASAIKAGTLDLAVIGQPPAGGSARLSWYPILRREMVLMAPPNSTETSLEALFAKYEWIRLDRATTMGGLAARFVHSHVKHKHGEMEFDSVPAIVAMVNAGLGVSIVALVEPSICLTYPVRILRLDPPVPTLQIALVMRQADDTDRRLIAVREAIEEVMRGTHDRTMAIVTQAVKPRGRRARTAVA